MAYENLCMYCFKEKGQGSICPHCGKDERTAVPEIQLLPGTYVYNGRFLIGRALGQDANGIVYNAMDTRKGGMIRIREYLPRNCAERLTDGIVVPVNGMEDAFTNGMRKLKTSVEGVDDPKKRHFYFEENGTAYIAQRKTGAAPAPRVEDADDDIEENRDHRRQIIIYICIAAVVVLGIAIGIVAFLNSLDSDDKTTVNPQLPVATTTVETTWMPNITPTPTPRPTATFSALKDPELSWMDYTYSGDVNQEFNDQVINTATKKPTFIIEEEEDYSTISSKSSPETITKLQQYLAKLGWLDASRINGKYDDATRQAVKDFQNYVNENCSPSKKLAVDGIAGKQTQQWMFNSNISLVKPTPTPEPLVTAAPDDAYVDANSSASIIRDMQKKLVYLGLLPENGADGSYGPTTATAVKNFQARVNQLLGYNVLEITGKVDELTMAYLNYYVEWWENNRPENGATPTPTIAPTPTVEIFEPNEGEGENPIVDANAPKESITFVQEMLAAVGLMKNSQIDGVYGRITTDAVIAFQQEVNRRNGANTVPVSGVCDAATL
ncbi:MAG: peptidoglycan-binding protein, partial [Clostridia bacterium]|nr:peptidoglycan-binding protein [Clostridia bacterium]